ncbi:MAG: hypothetical protein JWN14_180, partial [Chthonomonadales bacterium]|nr:hypothetical protein [Chthonomonadales bacterium]
MNTTLATETLRTGERLTIECILAPEPDRETQIRPFLGHKPANYRAHIDGAFAGQCDELETRFYIGLLNGEMVGNIMTVETGGIGIFGHVHTREDQRRKGICDAIMRHQMREFSSRNGHVLLLGTGYQSPAYRIYETHGFRDWPVGHPGAMRYDRVPQAEFEAKFFAAAPSQPVPARWKHWPLVALLATVPVPATLRSLTMDLWNVGLMEGSYSHFLHLYGARPDAFAAVLESATGAVTALATCVPDKRWPGIYLLDLFAHPVATVEDLACLLQSLPL